MKLGKSAKAKLSPEAHWAAQSLVDCSLPVKGREHYSGIYYVKDIGYWFSTDGFRVFGTSLIGDLGGSGKYTPKSFAENLELVPIPEATSWFPDFASLFPRHEPSDNFTLSVPGVVAAADLKKYTGHMTMNFENDGVFVYFGQLPEGRLSEKHLHFNMHYWSHVGGENVRVLYYGKQAPLVILPAESRNIVGTENKWCSLIMPTKDPGEILFSRTEG